MKFLFTQRVKAAMNISFVLDEIMDGDKGGVRPLDIPKFREMDQVQPLRIVTSAVRDGKMETVCFGSKENDFFENVKNNNDDDDDENNDHKEGMTTTIKADGKRKGLLACLETSMTVPGAAGPPIDVIRYQDAQTNTTSTCFDAYCYEPIPYRTAVHEGATHVLVLRSRPDGAAIGTKPGVYEKIVAPVYFESNGLPQLSSFFAEGGQQYLYVEDYLTLEEGRVVGSGEEGKAVKVPPQKLLYGVERDEEVMKQIQNRDNWKEANLLPVVVPEGNAELSTLSVDKDEVLVAVRQGFAAAFDLLSPFSTVKFDENLTGEKLAELLLPVTTTTSDYVSTSETSSLSDDEIIAELLYLENDLDGLLSNNEDEMEEIDENEIWG